MLFYLFFCLFIYLRLFLFLDFDFLVFITNWTQDGGVPGLCKDPSVLYVSAWFSGKRDIGFRIFAAKPKLGVAVFEEDGMPIFIWDAREDEDKGWEVEILVLFGGVFWYISFEIVGKDSVLS